MGVPQNGWFIMENPIKIDHLGVPLFQETTICELCVCVCYKFYPVCRWCCDRNGPMESNGGITSQMKHVEALTNGSFAKF